MTTRKLVEVAKVIQPHLEQFAGNGGGARVWMSEVGQSLRALIWTDKANGWNRTQRQTNVVDHLYLLPKDIAQIVSRVTILTPFEYEEEYFFTKPPFCEEG